MELKYGLISVDDHVQEHPEVWTQRLSQANGVIVSRTSLRQADGTEYWVVDGREAPHERGGFAGAAMPDRAREPQRWAEVPRVAYDPTARLQAMDVDGVDSSVLYPIVAGVAGETFGRLTDPELSNSPACRPITTG